MATNEEITAGIEKYLALGEARIGKGFPPTPNIYDQLAEITRRAFMPPIKSDYEQGYICVGIDPAYSDDEQLVPMKAKSVPVVVHKPFPDVLGFTDHPMAPLVEWPK